MLLSVDALSHVYRSPFLPERKALSDVSFSIMPDEIVAVVGAAGSGKTTLIQHFNGLLRPTQGRVSFDAMDLSDTKTDLVAVRREVGLVFQFPERQLFEETVYDDVAFGPRNLRLPEEEVESRVRRTLALVGLDYESFSRLSPFRLSGGEMRRVAIAGVLTMEPRVLVLDEPTVGLDGSGSQKVEGIIETYHRLGRTVIFVSHNMDLVARLATRVVVLWRGSVLFDGTKDALFRDGTVLERAGLTLPQVCRFLQELRKSGHPVRTDVYTIEAAKQEMDRVLR